VLSLLSACSGGLTGNNSPAYTPQPVAAASFPAAPMRTASKSPAEIDAWVEDTVAKMPLRQKIGQLIITGVPDDFAKERTCEQIQMLRPAGVTFQYGNIQNPEQLRSFIRGLGECARQASDIPLLFTLSHEGENTRFAGVITPFPAALAQGATGDPETAYQAALAAGQELSYSGINMVLGPVADVLSELDNLVIYDRAFGGDPQQVSRFVEQATLGYEEAGLIPALKHFPGHGGVAEDSHEELPVDNASREQMEAEHLPPFRSGMGAGAPVIMLSHIAYPAISGAETSATLSPGMMQFLRGELGYTGVVLSDSMRMKAVNTAARGVEQASLQAVQAGVDLLLLNEPSQARLARNSLVEAVEKGRLSRERVDEAVRRVLTLKAVWGVAFPDELQTPEPDWEAHAALLQEMGLRIPALVTDEAGYVPLPATARRILIVAPEKEWDFYTDLAQALEAQGRTVEMALYPAPWEAPVEDAARIASLASRMEQFDLALVFTWQAHLLQATQGRTWQVELVQALHATGRPLVVVAFASPTDLLSFPDIPAFIAMLGSTPGQQQAVIAGLSGARALEGRMPLPGLLP
jgi:beta-N-acetylhexosaminidase